MDAIPDPPVRRLRPAEHVVPAPSGGWAAADLDPSELVDDDFIDADPTSEVVQRGT